MRASLLVVLPVIAVEVAVRGANEQIKCHVPKNTLQIYDLFEYQQRIWEKMWGVPLFSAWPSRTFCKGKEKVLEGLLENKGWLFLNKGALLENNPWLLRKRTQGVPPVFLKITSRLPQDYLKITSRLPQDYLKITSRLPQGSHTEKAGWFSFRATLFSLKGNKFSA